MAMDDDYTTATYDNDIDDILEDTRHASDNDSEDRWGPDLSRKPDSDDDEDWL